jgi:hypothetical protein
MKLSTFLSIVAVVAVLFGIAFVLAPVETLAPYGVVADRNTAIMGRFFGAALLTVGLIAWFARPITDSVGRRAILIGNLIGDVVGFIVALQGQLNGVTNALGWSTVVIYGVFALGFACFLFGARNSA